MLYVGEIFKNEEYKEGRGEKRDYLVHVQVDTNLVWSEGF